MSSDKGFKFMKNNKQMRLIRFYNEEGEPTSWKEVPRELGGISGLHVSKNNQTLNHHYDKYDIDRHDDGKIFTGLTVGTGLSHSGDTIIKDAIDVIPLTPFSGEIFSSGDDIIFRTDSLTLFAYVGSGTGIKMEKVE